jgi:hypothetical protein
MNIGPLLEIGLKVVKSAIGKDVTEEIKKEPFGFFRHHDEKPWWLSRKVIGAATALTCGLLARLAGLEIPDGNVIEIATNIEKLGNLFMDNKVLFGSAWGSLILVVGIIFKKKGE